MLSELQPSNYPSITALLGNFTDYPVVNAVLEGSTPGRVFADHEAAPQSAFVLTNAGFSYLVGNPNHEAYNHALGDLLNTELIPKIHGSDDPTLVFYPLTNGWESPLRKMIGKRKVFDIYRKQFSFNLEKFAQRADQHNQVPAGFSFHPIDQEMLAKTGADMFPWESTQAFLKKGFGFWLMTDNEIACECWSVFASRTAVEIEIHTQEKYRRQGLAAIAASAFIEECLARGLRPNWECWWDNQPSISLAQKLGFKPIKNHPVFLVEIQKNNQRKQHD
jgi:RimJ/RimL family protein N-acetyltransferase